MTGIPQTIQHLVTLSDGKIAQSLLTFKPVEVKNIKGLKYVSQRLSTDVVELSPRFSAKISKATLQALVDKNLTLQEISTKLNLPMTTVRYYLDKYKISRFSPEVAALKKYFFATNPTEKTKAFEVIDTYLGKIAQKESEVHKDCLPEDCLQDVRLRFFELVAKKDKNPSISVYNILQKVEESVPAPQPKMEKVSLKTIADKMGASDENTDRFEISNLVNFLFNHSFLTSREKEFLKRRVIDECTLNDIAEFSSLTVARVCEIIKEAISKINKAHVTNSGEFKELPYMQSLMKMS